MQTQPYKQPPGPWLASLHPQPCKSPGSQKLQLLGAGPVPGEAGVSLRRRVELGEDRKSRLSQLLVSGKLFFFSSFFFLSCLFRSKPDLAGSQAVPCSIFDSSHSCCSEDRQPLLGPHALRLPAGRTPPGKGAGKSGYSAVPHQSLSASPTSDFLTSDLQLQTQGGVELLLFLPPSLQGPLHSFPESRPEDRAPFPGAGSASRWPGLSCAHPTAFT